MRHIVLGSKVAGARRVEGEIRVGFTTHVLAIGDTAQVPERPARGSRGTRDIAGVCLEEVDLIERGCITRAT